MGGWVILTAVVMWLYREMREEYNEVNQMINKNK